MQAYYRMEAGALVTDVSGQGKDLTNVNSVAEVAGKFGGAADLGAGNTNKYLYRNNDTFNQVGNGALTMSFWVKLKSEIGSGDWALIEKNNNNGDKTHAVRYQYNGGTRRLHFWNDTYGVGSNSIYFNITLGTSEWHHIVYVCDGTNFWGFVNGKHIGTANVYATANNYATVFDRINIGASWRASGEANPINFASAMIDDVNVWNRVFYSYEVKELYEGYLLGETRMPQLGLNRILALKEHSQDLMNSWNNGIDTNISYVGNGKFGKCAQFNGSNSGIKLDTYALPIPEVTFDVWIKHTTGQTKKVGIMCAGSYRMCLWLNTDDTVNYGIWLSTGNQEYASRIALARNKWNNITFAVKSANYYRLYINGQLIESGSIAGNLLADNSYIEFGKHPGVADNYLNGYLCEAKIYNRILSSREILTRYAQAVGKLQ